MVLPLSSLLSKNAAWKWSEEQDKALNVIKIALQQAPILWLPDLNKDFIVTTDASHEYVMKLYYIVVYLFNCKMLTANCIYIYIYMIALWSQ